MGGAWPLTPPPTVRKKGGDVEANRRPTPKKLLPQLRKSSGKIRYKRPQPRTVFCIDDYVDGLGRSRRGDKEVAEYLVHALQDSHRMVVVSGAGVSVAAGIPDFRSSEGLFTTLRNKRVSSGKELFDYNTVYASDEMNMQFNRMTSSLHAMVQATHPTGFHKMLDEFARQGRLQRLYTQNIDGLDTQLPNLLTQVPLSKPAPRTIQLHGSINHMQCNRCSQIVPFNPTLFLQNANDTLPLVPSCAQCMEFEQVRQVAGLRPKGVGKLRPRIVLYNELHPEGDIIAQITNKDMKQKPDCLIIVGTSLKIPGVKQICQQFARKVHQHKGIVIYANRDMPSQSLLDSLGYVDLIVLGDCQNIPKLLV